MGHSLKRCSSPDCWSMCLIQRQVPPFEAVVCGGGGSGAPLLLPMYAISKPFPTGRNTDLTTRTPL